MDARMGWWAAGGAAAAAAALLVAPAAGAGTALCDGREATIVGSRGPDVLTGTAGEDVFQTGAGRDVVDGRGGDDVVCTGAGPDLATDGRGDDELYLGPGDDVAQPATGEADVFAGGSGVDRLDYQLVGFDGPGVTVDLVAHTAGGVAGSDRVRGFEGVAGSYGRDVLRGTTGPDTLSGDAGHDALIGRGGDDRIVADLAPDTVNAGAGDDTLVVPGDGIRQGPDAFVGGPGVDLLTFARAYSGPGLVVDLAAGTVRGLGQDTVTGVEDVTGTNLRGDTLSGDAGDNVLRGLGGGDTLDGGGGADRADGGVGADACRAETVVDCES